MFTTQKQTVLAIVGFGLLGLAASIAFHYWRAADPARQSSAMSQSSGNTLAQLAARFGTPQSRILLLAPDLASLGKPELRAWAQKQQKALQTQLKSGQTVVACESLATPTGRSKERSAALTLSALTALAQKYPAADLIISLAGAPAVDATPGKLPRLICFTPTGEHVATLMKQGLLAAAIVPRSKPVPTSALSGDWFDIMYEVVTPDTVQAWQAALGGQR